MGGPPAQRCALDQLSALMASLSGTPGHRSGTTLLDDTLVVVISEMTRTPRMNPYGGKDHWPWATVALLGGGVTHGVSGRTDAEQAGQLVNLDTGGAGDLELRAEHLFAGVLEHMGVDAGLYSAAPALRGWMAP